MSTENIEPKSSVNESKSEAGLAASGGSAINGSRQSIVELARARGCRPCGTYECQVPMPLRGRRQDVDLCVADLVAALNAANIVTMASCCGHGEQDGSVALEDGRELIVRNMQTIREIKESADMAETYPESEVLNWGEISFDTLLDWVTQQKNMGEQDVFLLDVESVKGCFERWWKRSNDLIQGLLPNTEEVMEDNKFESRQEQKSTVMPCYVAMLDHTEQVGYEQSQTFREAKTLTGEETVGEILSWAKRFMEKPQVMIVLAT